MSYSHCNVCGKYYSVCACNKVIRTTREIFNSKFEEKIKAAKARIPTSKGKLNGGGDKNYYDLPEEATQLLDLIEFRNMNGNIKDIFKACYRLGEKEGTSVEYDMQKIVLYAIRELGRVQGRRDYLNIAEEVIGHHDTTSIRRKKDIEFKTGYVVIQ